MRNSALELALNIKYLQNLKQYAHMSIPALRQAKLLLLREVWHYDNTVTLVWVLETQIISHLCSIMIYGCTASGVHKKTGFVLSSWFHFQN